jgi:hypothetical protein
MDEIVKKKKKNLRGVDSSTTYPNQKNNATNKDNKWEMG